MQNMLQALEPGSARALKRTQNWTPKLWRSGSCGVVLADAECADGNGGRARQRRFSGGPG
eukprot:8000416-Alexandrium_andersonii.AAC.1